MGDLRELVAAETVKEVIFDSLEVLNIEIDAETRRTIEDYIGEEIQLRNTLTEILLKVKARETFDVSKIVERNLT